MDGEIAPVIMVDSNYASDMYDGTAEPSDSSAMCVEDDSMGSDTYEEYFSSLNPFRI